MRILLALGGGALRRRGEAAAADAQQRSVAAAAEVLAAVASEHEVVIAHGDRPRVGADSEGMVGHMLELALRNALSGRDLVTVLSEVVVSADDPALEELSRNGSGCRRAAPSLEPQAIVELRSLRTLIDAGALVVCAGCGGIPVMIDGSGTMQGVEAAVDRDLTAALLARRLDADLLVMLTDVDAVHLDWGRDHERALGSATPAELREHGFAPGSIGPKVEAACRFVEATGRRAAIGELEKAVEIVRGVSGTQVSAHRA
jgi:carbamate kinase